MFVRLAASSLGYKQTRLQQCLPSLLVAPGKVSNSQRDDDDVEWLMKARGNGSSKDDAVANESG